MTDSGEVLIVFILFGSFTLMVIAVAYLYFNTRVKLGQQRETSYVASEGARFDVFLSYSAEDRAEAGVIAQAISAAQMRVFFAHEHLQGGSPFSDEIRDALRDSREVWVLATPASVDSVWVATEWGTAWALGKRIVPVLLNTNHERLPDRLRTLHVVDFRDISSEIERAIKRIQEARSLGRRSRFPFLLRRSVVVSIIILALGWLFLSQCQSVFL